MQAQSELISLPQALTEIFTKGRADRERAVRAIRWGDGPIHVLTGSQALPAGLMARYALEDLLQRPVILREASSFLAYSLATLRTGAPVVAVSGENQAPELLEAVLAVRRGGAQVLAVASPSSAIAQEAHQLFALPEVAGSPAAGLAGACLEHAAMGFFALIAARLLTRPAPALERLEKDWEALPGELDKIVAQFANAIRSLARELGSLSRVFFSGAGLYYASARRAADAGGHRRFSGGLALDFARLGSAWLEAFGPDTGALLITGSRSRFRKQAGELVRQLKERGSSVFAITDANDQEVTRQARLTLLMPDLAELPSSLLALALAGWTARESVRPGTPGAGQP